jgi:YD repeat-containing protein
MIASTWFDLVLGLDFHVVGIVAPPSPVPMPTPVPMPFVGLVFGPAGLAVGAAMGMALGGGPGLVLINGLPATNCGTNVTTLLTMPHVPAPGVAFIPPPAPGNDAELFFGSEHVTIGGSLGVRLGDIALSCSDPVRLPTSTVLALPKGAPVLNTPPMVPDASAIAIAGAAHGALLALGPALRAGGKLFRQLRQVQKRSGGWARVSQALRNAVEHIAPKRYRDRLKRAVCFVTGHPVDVATGRVFTNQTDFALPGPLPLVFERVYSSSLSWRDGPLGHGWSHSLDQAVWMEEGKVVYLAEDGREIEFLLDQLPDGIIRPGDEVYEPTNRLTLTALGGYKWKIETHEGITHEFAPVKGAADPTRAKLLLTRTRDNHRIELFYDARGLLESVRDACGRLIFFQHDGRGRLTEIKLPLAREHGWIRHVSFVVDDHGDLVKVVDAKGSSFAFLYQGHLLVRETDRTGLSFYFQYDGTGSYARCIRTWGDGGIYDHLIDYDRRNRKTFVEDSLGRSTVYTLDDLGMVVKVTDPHGKSTTYSYDPESGQEATVTGPLGATTRCVFDERGNCVSVTGPDGATTTIDYDARCLPVRAVDVLGGVWRWAYDREGHLAEEETPAGEITLYGYARGLLSWLETPEGERATFLHDEHKNLILARAPNGAETRYLANNRGSIVKITDARGAVTRIEHDALDRVVRVLYPLGLVEQIVHDAEGNIVGVRTGSRQVRFSYSGVHMLIAREEAGTRVAFERDTEGQMVAVLNEACERYGFKLDACGRVIEETGFDGKIRRYQHDAEGRAIKVRLPSGRTSRITYDVAGRITRIDHSDGTFTELDYRKDSALIRATNESGTVTFERDAMGRVLREAMGDVAIDSRYDRSGNRVSRRTSLGHETAYDLDPGGMLCGVSFGMDPRFGDFSPASLRMGGPPVRAPWRATFQRDALGNETARALPGPILAQWEHDEESRPAVHRVSRSGIELSSVGYHFGPEGDLAMLVDRENGPTRFTHDERAFLVAATRTDGSAQLRAVDITGNVFKTADKLDRRYGAGGCLNEADGTRYVHDADGQLVERVCPDAQRWRYRWNGRGELIEVTRPDGKRVAFAYDAFGRRIRKDFEGRSTSYVWDGDDLVHELTDGSPLVTGSLSRGRSGCWQRSKGIDATAPSRIISVHPRLSSTRRARSSGRLSSTSTVSPACRSRRPRAHGAGRGSTKTRRQDSTTTGSGITIRRRGGTSARIRSDCVAESLSTRMSWTRSRGSIQKA